jgi:OFA family oxalate/formate antiporter-like MFS transporter
LFGALIVQLILGTIYGYSIFWQPLESETGLAQNQANYAFALCILSFAVTMVIAGRVQDVKGPRFPAIVGAIFMGGGFLLASMMKSPLAFFLAHAAFTGAVAIVLLMIYHAVFGKTDPEEMPVVKYIPMGIMASVITGSILLGNRYFANIDETDKLFLLWGTVGFLAGAGVGLAYVCPIAALVKWFPDHKGLVSGIAVAGFGFGAYIFSHKAFPFSAENYIKDHGITDLFFLHGIVCLVAVIIGAMLLKNPPRAATPQLADTSSSTWQDTIKKPAFYILWLMFFSGALAGLMVIGVLKPFAGGQLIASAQAADPGQWADVALAEARKVSGADFGLWLEKFPDQNDAALKWVYDKGVAAVGWLAIFNAIGRVFWGFISDRIGRTQAFVTMFLFQAVTMFILGSLNRELTLAVGACVVGFNFGGNFALFPSATADFFGAKNLGANYGWVFTSYGIAGVVGIMLGNTAYEKTGSYTVAFMLAGALCLVSAGLAIWLKISRQRLLLSVNNNKRTD